MGQQQQQQLLQQQQASMAQAQQPVRGVRWGQNEVRYMTPQPEEEASPRDAHSLFSLAFGGGNPTIGAFAPGGGFGGHAANTFAANTFAPVADTREACAPISASRLVQRR